MKLGAFSLSLNVQDIALSKTFYEKLGFETFHDSSDQGWCILKNGETILGLYQGHVAANTLTFNPGWDQNAKEVTPFDDVRAIQAALQADGVTVDVTCDESTTGPAHITLTDPDGNAILIDQHV